MPKFILPAVLCLGSAGLMVLPLVVPVSFAKGISGRSSLFPEWVVAVFFYSIMAVVAVLAGRAAIAEFRQSKRQIREVWARRFTVVVREGKSVELANIAQGEGSAVRVSLLDVRSNGRSQFVGTVSLRGDPPSVLGELIHSESTPIAEFGNDLPGKHAGVLEWVTTEFETEHPDTAPVLASIEVRLLAKTLHRNRRSAE